MAQTKAQLIDGKGDAAFDTNTLFIDSTNNRVGIGTTSPSTALQVIGTGRFGDGTNGSVNLLSASSNQNYVDSLNNAANAFQSIQFRATNLRFLTAASGTPSERAQIDSSGRLLVGTSSTSAAVNSLFQARSNSSTGGAILMVTRGNATPADGNELGIIDFADSGHTAAARIISARDGGTWTSGSSQPTRLVFSTTPDGSASPVAAMMITNNGTVLTRDALTIPNIFTSNASLKVLTSAGVTTSLLAVESRTSSTSLRYHTIFGNPNGVVGSISTNASATAYTTSSDYRLKENVVDLNGAIDRLKQLPVHRFNFIADPDTVVDGFLAHEAAEVVPEAVTGTKDEVDEDGNPVYQGIDQSKLVPLLTAALQEAVAKIEALEAKVAALETN